MTLTVDQVESLRHDVAGTVISPAEPEWGEARRFHSGTGSPDVIVRPADVAQVRAAVAWAAAAGLPVVVRGGGHSAWSAVPGGLVVDLADMADVAVRVDDAGPVVGIGGGALWGAVARALAPHGLALSSGDTASVGVGGLTLGGGIGWMVRAWGLASDQLIGAQLVTAAGDVVEATDASHPDLMWGLRGGGGNFGVVTRFDFRAHALPALVHAAYTVDGDRVAVIRAVRDLLVDAPPELTVTYMDVPAMDPSAPAGATLTAVWIGDDPDRVRNLLAPVTSLPGVHERTCAVTPYPDILLDGPPVDPDAPAPGFIGGNTLLPALTDEGVERLVSFRADNPASVLFLRSLGGRFGEIPPDASAWAARDATWFAMAGAFDLPGLVDDAHRARLEADWGAVEARGSGVYGNFTMSTDPGWVLRMYPPATLTRLRALKATWDPANVFRRNHNVVPA